MMAGEGREPLVEPPRQRLGAVLGREIGGEIAHERREIALRDRRGRLAHHHRAGAEAFDDEAKPRQLLAHARRCSAAASGSRSTISGVNNACRSIAPFSRSSLSRS